ncbi:MAG: glycerophosphoryl diester phosphodiesterase [Myxococcota bacterium]|jgi:glycerophosphoryl diester phosphodiesterase
MTHNPNDRALVIAHRGASYDHPENTLRAFSAALDNTGRADGVELDVQITTDGVPMVFHDDDLDRLSDGAGPFADRSSEDIAKLKVGGEPIPTLAAVCELVARLAETRQMTLMLNVELKTTHAPKRMVTACRALLDEAHANKQIRLVVSSFDPRVLAAAQEEGCKWPMAFLYEDEYAVRALAYLDGAEALDLHPRCDLVDRNHIREYSERGRVFRTWTVDDPREARRLVSMGVKAIITNKPRLIRDALDVDA